MNISPQRPDPSSFREHVGFVKDKTTGAAKELGQVVAKAANKAANAFRKILPQKKYDIYDVPGSTKPIKAKKINLKKIPKQILSEIKNKANKIIDKLGKVKTNNIDLKKEVSDIKNKLKSFGKELRQETLPGIKSFIKSNAGKLIENLNKLGVSENEHNELISDIKNKLNSFASELKSEISKLKSGNKELEIYDGASGIDSNIRPTLCKEGMSEGEIRLLNTLGYEITEEVSLPEEPKTETQQRAAMAPTDTPAPKKPEKMSQKQKENLKRLGDEVEKKFSQREKPKTETRQRAATAPTGTPTPKKPEKSRRRTIAEGLGIKSKKVSSEELKELNKPLHEIVDSQRYETDLRKIKNETLKALEQEIHDLPDEISNKKELADGLKEVRDVTLKFSAHSHEEPNEVKRATLKDINSKIEGLKTTLHEAVDEFLGSIEEFEGEQTEDRDETTFT